MSIPSWELMSASWLGVMILLWIAIFLAFYRLVRGPSLADRIVALDLIATLVVGVIVIHAIAASQPVYLMAAIVVGLVSFLGTVAFALFIQKGGRP